ncbi:bifunctional phosphoribosylaminoimidazolecarboxamide formyltransferase/IMP cyclohydrolase [Stomatohabitans albus]|uniref:bifunctional phosphoribosylaminoimidazolecarboxamide formyltransferase/IMP cyclohydrolase n=1 Tax=Stomatohabitans albus TaxID=3110766 RepID=UPI00300DA3D6
MTQIARALISVFDKTGLVDLAQRLHSAGVELISTGSTAQHIANAGIPVTSVDQITGFPEMMDGRVKTLHPMVHGAILADRAKQAHVDAMDEHGMSAIDLVVVNLYPFADTIADPANTPAACIEMIDIGGPTMVRSAAKNHAHVTVVTTPAEYDGVLSEIESTGGTTLETRRRLAGIAFAHTADYDRVVAGWFAQQEATGWAGESEGSGKSTGGQAAGGGCGCCKHNADGPFPETLEIHATRRATLRYGENPHQEAAWYVGDPAWGLGTVEVLGGKELSYNNLVDTDAAFQLVNDFTDPAIAIIKHMNPAGAAVASSLAEAYPRALAGDPVSAFGGIVAANRQIDAATAQQIVEVFTEVVVAPGYTPEALEILGTKKNLRILNVANPERPAGDVVIRSIVGGFLVQGPDNPEPNVAQWECVTEAQPANLDDLVFAWQVCKHVKSNAIVLAHDQAVVGVGAGQMSRVDSVNIAVTKSNGRASGSVLASDAFFPFADGVEAAIAAGVTAVVQPGGSVRDEEVIAACNKAGVPMVFTGRRHFRH